MSNFAMRETAAYFAKLSRGILDKQQANRKLGVITIQKKMELFKTTVMDRL